MEDGEAVEDVKDVDDVDVEMEEEEEYITLPHTTPPLYLRIQPQP